MVKWKPTAKVVWARIEYEQDYQGRKHPKKEYQDYLYMDLCIRTKTSTVAALETARAFASELERRINDDEDLQAYGKASLLRCDYFDFERNTYYDSITWTRAERGDVAEQKRDIIAAVRRIIKSM